MNTSDMLGSIADRKIRFALVGCGRISRNHVAAIEKHGDTCELVDICDIDAEALASAAKSTEATPHSSLSSLLKSTTADCVILATPSGLHSQQTIRIAESGRHVMTEKPMATRWQDGLAMVEACDNAGIKLFVVKQNRQNARIVLRIRAITSVAKPLERTGGRSRYQLQTPA